MRSAAVLIACLASTAVLAQGECKKERALTKQEQTFFDRAKSTAKALPAAPGGWEKHPEEITAPAKLCADADPMLKSGQARLNVVTETEYRDPTDRSAKQEAAMKAGQPTPDETKKSTELAKRMVKSDGGSELQTLQAEHQKLQQTQAERVNKAIHAAGLDGEARIRISINPVSESSTGCGYQKEVVSIRVAGATHTFSGTCDFSSNPQEPEAGMLLLFGQWTQKSDATTLEAAPAFDSKKSHTVIQAISVLITGDRARPAELMKALDLKAIGALIGK